MTFPMNRKTIVRICDKCGTTCSDSDAKKILELRNRETYFSSAVLSDFGTDRFQLRSLQSSLNEKSLNNFPVVETAV